MTGHKNGFTSKARLEASALKSKNVQPMETMAAMKSINNSALREPRGAAWRIFASIFSGDPMVEEHRIFTFKMLFRVLVY